VVNGGAGTDTLSIAVAGGLPAADYTLSAVQTNFVEKVLLNNFDTHATRNNIVDTALMSGLTTVGLSASSAEGDTIFTGLNGLVGAELRNGAGDLTLTYNAAVVAGAADTQAVTVSNLSAGTFTADGAETIAITSELVKSTLTNVASNSLKTITVAGAADLTISTALTAATINAAAATGTVSLKLGAANQTVSTGAGNDTIDAAGNLSNADTIVGGAGTDTLKLSVGNATVAVGTSAAKGDLFNVSGVEVIDIASTNDAATLNLDTTSGVTTAVAAANVKTYQVTAVANSLAIAFTLNGVAYTTDATDANATAAEAAVLINAKINTIPGFSSTVATDTVTITATTGEAIEIGAPTGGATAATISAYNDVSFTNVTTQAIDVYSADAVTASLKDASGTADVLAVSLKTLSADKGFDQAIGTITANNIETINLGVTGMTDGKIKTVAALTGNAVKTLNITGDSDLTITAFTGSTALTTIDGSTASGDLILSAAPAAKDQSIKTGSGNDTINMGAFLTVADTIDGGANNVPAGGTSVGNDKVTATGNIGTVTLAAALKMTNVEAIEVATGGVAATYIDAAGIVGAKSMGFSATSGTVKVTNLAAGVSIGLGETTNRFEGTVDVSLADATGAADSISFTTPSFDAATTIALTVAAAVETVNIAATTNAGNARTATFTNTNNAAKNIVVTAGQLADTVALGTLNAATTNVDASVFAGILTGTTAATGAVTLSAKGGLAHNLVAGAGADTITLVGANSTAAPTLNGNAGTDVLNVNLDNAASDFTNVSNIETINVTVSGNKQAGFNNGTADNGLNAATTVNVLGGDTLSTFTIGTAASLDDDATGTTLKLDASAFAGAIDIAVASDAFDAELSILAGAMTTDKVSIIIAGTDNKVALMSGVETLTVSSTDADADAAMDLSNVTGLVTLNANFVTTAAADFIKIDKLAAGVAVKTTLTETGDNLVINLASVSGTTDVLGLEVVEFNDATDGTDRLNFDAAGIETLNLKMSNAETGRLLLDGVTATTGSTVTINVSGAGVAELNSLSSSIRTVVSTGTGALTIAAADRTSSAMTITGGEGGDSIAMRNSSDVLNGGLGTDTLVLNTTFVLGGVQVDLSSAADQITSFNGSANAAVQIGFENVDLSGVSGTFGADITARAAGSTITGTGNADQITGGAGVDNITGGAGADVMSGGAGADTFVFANTSTGAPSATVFDSIQDYATGSDIIDFGAITLLQSPNAAAAAAGHAAVTAGVVTFHANDNTLALRIIAVEDAISDNDNAADSNDAAAGDALVFAFGSDSYIFVSDGTLGVSANDVLIKLTGIAGGTATDSLTIVGGDITALA
jgi:Ca2+-binding RTX toxin-like protein